MHIILNFFLFLGSFQIACSQTTLPDDFARKLKSAGIEFLEPTEAKVKKLSSDNNAIFPADAIFKIKKGKLEIKMKIELLQKNLVLGKIPHIEGMRMASNVASNEEESMVVVHEMPTDLLRDYAADWGAIYYFKPKSFVTGFRHCKQVALFKKDKAMVTILYLFNDENTDLDQLGQLVRFVP